VDEEGPGAERGWPSLLVGGAYMHPMTLRTHLG